MKNNNFDKEKIIERIGDIKQAVVELEKYKKTSLKKFENKNDFYLACYWLRIGIEAILTISTHILSRIPSNGKKKDYTQVILSLADYNIIPKQFAQNIKGMAGYRNRLVHLYWKVSPEEILAIIKENLTDFNKFIKHIEKFVGKKL